jgi:hypothetical protein
MEFSWSLMVSSLENLQMIGIIFEASWSLKETWVPEGMGGIISNHGWYMGGKTTISFLYNGIIP